MGTIKSSETLAFAEHLRAQRGTTQEQEEERVHDHAPLVRYQPHDRAAAAAH